MYLGIIALAKCGRPKSRVCKRLVRCRSQQLSTRRGYVTNQLYKRSCILGIVRPGRTFWDRSRGTEDCPSSALGHTRSVVPFYAIRHLSLTLR